MGCVDGDGGGDGGGCRSERVSWFERHLNTIPSECQLDGWGKL